MFLAIDIGNTNITLGVFDDNLLLKTLRLKTDTRLNKEEYKIQIQNILNGYKITDCVIVSVVEELVGIVKDACQELFSIEPFVVSLEDFGMKIALDEPQKVGLDRIVNAYAAKSLYPLPAIIIDAGTAITFDVVSKDGVFLGGVIMPGINLQLKSLNLYTSKLPNVNADISPKAIGANTEEAILSGVVRGTSCGIEKLIEQCEEELNAKASIIATGGQCYLIAKHISRPFDYINNNLILEGIKNLYFSSHVNLY